MNNTDKFKKKINTVDKRNKIVCHYPWSSFYVSPEGNVKHCCSTNLNSLGNLSEQTVDEIWNGKLFQLVRSRIAVGDFDGAYCNPNCQGLRTRDGYPWPERTTESIEIAENEDKARKNFNNCVRVVDHLPLHLQLEFSNNCNFRCIMCYYEFKPPYNFIPKPALEKLIEISGKATVVSLMGGEVFMNKRDLEFIDAYQPSDGAVMGFITNASYLNETMVEKLKKFKKMWMQISIDGTEKEVFEKIRRRGNWEVVDENIQRISGEAMKLKGKGFEWNINLAYVVMKSNFENLVYAIDYAARLEIYIGFYPVKGFHLYHENIFVYKNALKDLGDWRASLNAAYAALENHHINYVHYNLVLDRLKDIEKYMLTPKIYVSMWFVKVLKFLIPGRKKGNFQGLSRHESRVAHLIELYYNWRVGNTSLKSTLSYVLLKGFRYFRVLVSGRRKSNS